MTLSRGIFGVRRHSTTGSLLEGAGLQQPTAAAGAGGTCQQRITCTGLRPVSLLASLLLMNLIGCQRGETAPLELTAAEFEQQITSGRPLALVIFTAVEDAPEQLEALETQLHTLLAGRLPTFVVRSTEEDWTRTTLQVRQTPAVLAFQAGREVGRFLGPFREQPLSLWVMEITSHAANQHRVPDSPPPRSLEGAEFDQLLTGEDLPVLIDFWAEWCGPCKMLEAPLHELADDLQGQLVIAKVNVDEQKSISRRYVQGGIPLLVLFHHGKEIDRITGAPARNELRRWTIAWAKDLSDSTTSPPTTDSTSQDR
ncbi:MAG: thioredoxin domain-containing protein [Planctomycetaceae bacterium]